MAALFLPEWMTVSEAGRLLHLHDNTVYRLVNESGPDGQPALQSWKPSRGRLLVGRDSVFAPMQKTQKNPFYWEEKK